MAEGMFSSGGLLYGSSGMPIFASIDDPTGNPVYVKWPFDVIGSIEIAWENGDDLDINGYWTHGGGGGVGWSVGTNRNADGFYTKWRGDNTSGGPEYIYVGTDDTAVLTGDVTFRIHCNWYRCGRLNGKTGGRAHITAYGKNDTVKDGWMTPSNRTYIETDSNGNQTEHVGGKALTSDPYIDIVFDRFGLVKSVR